MWTEITRPQYERKGLRYSSDVTDAEWLVISAHLPPRKRFGRPPKTALRSIVDALLYMARTGCQWRLLPREFPPFTTVQNYFYAWRDNGILERINFELLVETREAAGREASPSAGIIDSQSVKTTESGGPRGYDAGKKVRGRKRHIVTDTIGLLLGAEVHSADIQDRDGAPLIVEAIHDLFPWPSLRRQCLFRGQTSQSSHPIRPLDGRDRQTRRSRLRRAPPPLGGRTNPRLAQSQPPVGQRL